MDNLQKNRIGYIDSAKGFAILLVVLGHVVCFDLYQGVSHDSALYRFIYSFHMPLFIFLSGLVSVTEMPKVGVLRDIWKRFRSLVVPFVVVGGAYSIFMHGNLNFIFENMKWGYWYLWALFVMCVLNLLFVKIRDGVRAL